MKPTTGEGVAPQCNTSAECLRELARVMEQFGIASPLEALLKYGRWGGLPIRHQLTVFECIIRSPELLTLAIAEVEGKPVFPDSSVYFNGEEWLIKKYENASAVLLMKKGQERIHRWVDISDLSLTKPRTNTVMVELPIDVVKFYASENWDEFSTPTREACKTALENLKS